MQIELPYGKGNIVYTPVKQTRVLTSRLLELKAQESGLSIVQKAMAHPIGSRPLHELAQGKKTCTIIISDHTRPVPSRDILPPMLEELRAGNPAMDITLLVATGFHRLTTEAELRSKLGDAVFDGEKIVVHDCERNNVFVGTLPSQAPLIADRAAVDTELLLAEGFIEPHFFAGFSGGRKSVLPGICDRATVLGNHCSAFIDSAFSRTGTLEGNPIHRDMVAAARMLHLSFIVNVVIDEQKKTAAAFAGNFEQAHEKGCAFLKPYCSVHAELADASVATNGGAPLDQNIYQCVKGMTAAEAATRPGGAVILCAECADGVGGNGIYTALRNCADPDELYARIMATPADKTEPDQWESQILARILRKHPVIMVTRPELKKTVGEMKMLYAATVDEAVSLAESVAGPVKTVNVIPNGVSVIVN